MTPVRAATDAGAPPSTFPTHTSSGGDSERPGTRLSASATVEDIIFSDVVLDCPFLARLVRGVRQTETIATETGDIVGSGVS